ncbi:MAG: zinc ribbon domain-containing protein [Oscillospiraceae bacterium]|jgi:hypothetical protein|nr:zinc ribbon domain-containing protein [Oscillospiraceae bacterium]
MKPCAHCGASLHEEASFCPYCARTVNERKAIQPARHMPRRALYSALIILCAAAVLVLFGCWAHSRPKVYDNGGAGAVYTSRSGSFHLDLSNWSDGSDRTPKDRWFSEVNYPYRYPVCLYVTRAEDETRITDEFMENVASITAEARSPDTSMSISCTDPEPDRAFIPDAATVIYVDYNILSPGEHEAELTCTITMKNGDIIRLRRSQQYPTTTVYKFTAQDVPMNTIQELQTFVDGLAGTTNEADRIYLYLPPVVYEGGLSITERPVNLCGSIGADGQHTAFTGPVFAANQRGILDFSDIDFLGSGQGVGVRASNGARIHLTDCRVSGWETGFLADGNAWIVASGTVFEHNAVGLCFDAEQGAVSDPYYMNDTFQDNGTAVLLERVPSDTPLSFPDTLFTGNGQDIDNPCGQKLELEGAVFQ